MGTYQRRLDRHEESPILLSQPGSGRCVNCHAFANYQPDRMLLHLRGARHRHAAGPRWGRNADRHKDGGPAGASLYSTWHPNGQLVAFSVNSPMLLEHAVGDCRDVFDYGAGLGVYDLHRNCVLTVPQIADPQYLQTFPAWSPDGKYLYFCRGAVLGRPKPRSGIFCPRASTGSAMTCAALPMMTITRPGERWKLCWLPRTPGEAFPNRGSRRTAAGCCSACTSTVRSRSINPAATCT